MLFPLTRLKQVNRLTDPADNGEGALGEEFFVSGKVIVTCVEQSGPCSANGVEDAAAAEAPDLHAAVIDGVGEEER